MSKKKKNQKKQESFSQSVASLTANGLKAFHQKDFEKAIATWERIPTNVRPAALLAEGHFQHGLALFYGTDPHSGLDHLQTALACKPGEARYAYHLGLAKHHLGDIPGALAAYQTARQTAGPIAIRAAYPLALALLQSDQDPVAAPVWKDLTPAEQSMLRSATAFRRRPYNPSPESPLLWRSLAALDAGDQAQARTGLEQVLTNGSTSPIEMSLAHFYLGALAAQAEDWDLARHEWEAAYIAGLRSPRLQDNLAEIFQRRAEELLLQGDIQTALAAVEESRRHQAENNSLDELLAQIYQHLGYQAATANHWDKAQTFWQNAVELDSSSFRLAYNLALAYEKSEDYGLAGQTWREALRRRPRRADHPDALNDEQVARLWQRAAECYRKAGEFEEVGHTYQQAIKWAPENMDLRVALAKNLIDDGRLLAGRNELGRLLERDPKHIPALLLLGEAFFRDEDYPEYNKTQAKQYWEQALALDPKHPKTRQMLAEWYFDQAEINYSWDEYTEAIENYQKSLEFRPDHAITLLFLAESFTELNDEAKGEEFSRQALACAARLDDFDEIVNRWICLGYDERAWEATIQAEARLSKIPIEFYVDAGCHALKHEREQESRRWLECAIQKAAPQDNVLVMIGEMAMDYDATVAMEYLQKAIQTGQEPGQAHLLMGILENKQGNRRAGNKHFSEAEHIAIQTRDKDLAEKVEMAHIMALGPQEMLRRLMDAGRPDLMKEFMNEFGDEFDEDFDDE